MSESKAPASRPSMAAASAYARRASVLSSLAISHDCISPSNVAERARARLDFVISGMWSRWSPPGASAWQIVPVRRLPLLAGARMMRQP